MSAVVAGVDGCPGGWIVATQAGEALPELAVRATFAEVRTLVDAAGAAAIAIDMPIGLATDGIRSADSLARARLGPRRSSLFPTPCRAVLDAETYMDALVASRRVTGKGISKQAWMLVPKIREVRAVLEPADAGRFAEVHPETSFTFWAGGPLPTKHGFEGQLARFRLTCEAFAVDEHWLASRPKGAKADDVFDALACLWTARRMLDGTAVVLGRGVDPDGYPLTLTV